jgi:hypothetical protein
MLVYLQSVFEFLKIKRDLQRKLPIGISIFEDSNAVSEENRQSVY